jgi:hypothetical protein
MYVVQVLVSYEVVLPEKNTCQCGSLLGQKTKGTKDAEGSDGFAKCDVQTAVIGCKAEDVQGWELGFLHRDKRLSGDNGNISQAVSPYRLFKEAVLCSLHGVSREQKTA